jgi:CubicO group peptidase (beta-lactamase class C family)
MHDEAIRPWFDERVAAGEFSGVALAWRDGAPIFTYAGGLAHRGLGVPNDPATRFAVASVTKMATAIAVLRLVDRGLLRLDQPLVDILPAEHRPVALTPEQTLHHLLSHTSGLANYHDDDDPTWASFTSCWDRVPTYHVRRPADMLPLFADLPAVGPPGVRYQYNDAAFILAGLAIEAVTGRAFNDVAAGEVFGPAGMTETAFEAIDEDPPRLAVGYMVEEGSGAGRRTNVFSVTAMGMPDGGMISTVTDLARLIDALLGDRLLSPELRRAMTTPQGPPTDAEEQWGYGCELTVRGGEIAVIGHSGSDPGVSARVSHYLAAETTVVVLCNQDRGSWAATIQIAKELGLEAARD